jgi:hypothetical protein
MEKRTLIFELSITKNGILRKVIRFKESTSPFALLILTFKGLFTVDNFIYTSAKNLSFNLF